MNWHSDPNTSRRLFLQFLASSPLLASVTASYAQDGESVLRATDPMMWGPLDPGYLLKTPLEAISAFDFEALAHANVPPAHFGYLTTGADGESTLRANRADFQRFALRPYRMRDVSKVDSSIELFGQKWDSPIFVCPTSSNAAFHPDGELAVSRAAGKGKHIQMLSTVASYGIEECIAARGSPIWFQLYATSSFEIAKSLLARAERAGSPVAAITVDVISTRKNETQARMRRMDKRECIECHSGPNGGGNTLAKPNYSQITPEMFKGQVFSSSNLDWDRARRLRDTTKMKVLLKGIMDPEDAALCVKYGFDGLVISNHGGRDDDGGFSTIRALPDIAASVNRRIPILIDSGFRRGMDIVKALAMGATAVGVGRPYLWGLGAFGQPGVERVLEILRTEVSTAMGQAGVTQIKELTSKMILQS